MAVEHVKRHSTLLVAGGCKLKPRAYPYCDWMQRYISQATFRGLVSPLYVSPWAVLANLGHSSFSAPSGVSGGSPSPSVCTCFLSDDRCRSQGHVLVNILHANSISESVSRRTASVTATHPLEWLRYLEKKNYPVFHVLKHKLETTPNIYSQLIFGKGAKAVQWRKDNHFNKYWWNSKEARNSKEPWLPIPHNLCKN